MPIPRPDYDPESGTALRRRRSARGAERGLPRTRLASGLAAPTPGGGFVFGPGGDPPFTCRGFLALPEGRVGFEPIDQEMAGGERGFAVGRGGGDQHDAVAGLEPAIAVDNQHRIERPARCASVSISASF